MSINGTIEAARVALFERQITGARVPDIRPAESSGKSADWVIGTGGISIAMLLFVSAALFLGLTLSSLRQSIALVEESEKSLLQISNLRESLFDAGSSARGFVTDHDRASLSEYRRARSRIVTSLDGLAAQLASEPAAVRQVNELRPLIARRLAILDQMIEAASKPAGQMPANDKERTRLTRLINGQVSRIRADEQRVLTGRQARATGAANFAIWLSLFTSIAAPLCGAFGIHLLHSERERNQARELEIEMMHAQRLAIMGETASMLAHEIRQPLSAAKNYLGALRRIEATAAQGPRREVGEIADKANDQINRANGIVQRLRNFIEKRDDERVAERVDDLVADAIVLLGTIDEGIVLETRIAPDLPKLLVDRIQIQQVLVNLMRNAIEAMERVPRRELHLAATVLDADTVLVSLEDTGPGLPAAIAANLFKPFVTTKESGMGVGLSICRSIVAAHGGRIWAETGAAGGAVFRFTLQAIRDED